MDLGIFQTILSSSVNDAISFIYAISGVIVVLGYLPTILDILKGTGSVNMKTYLIWTFTASSSFLYSIVVKQDLMLSLINGGNLICILTVLILGFRGKFKKNLQLNNLQKSF